MTSQSLPPPLPKWPFLVGDVLLLAVAWWIAARSPDPFVSTPLLLVVGCVLAGAWMAMLPFLTEHKARLKVTETDSLVEATRQIQDLKSIGAQVAGATQHWQEVEKQAGAAVSAVTDIASRMENEARAFAEFMEKADQSEKAHLRLEVEKLRRTEREWVEVLIGMLDHVYALHAAGVRSGKRPLIQQLTQFQHACRDVGRRVGLVPFEVEAGTPFDPEQHVRPDQESELPAGATVSETLATGYHFQGRLVRKPMVQWAVVQDNAQDSPGSASTEEDLFNLPSSEPAPDPEGIDSPASPTPSSTPR